MYWVDIVCCTGCAVNDEKAEDWDFKGREVKVGWYENGTDKNKVGRNPLVLKGLGGQSVPSIIGATLKRLDTAEPVFTWGVAEFFTILLYVF
ncbi:hypothetical protein HBN82_03480 [Pseudomonas lundensis]|uniref:hypothetical protein n=1 Tax=Pseudomonas lundensis TaxID=86185 RepID=UPI0014737B72|nr:hypothetical protein [Pseudomonas lundensis]NNA14928.1 hypothetical protein [Pseudomonas lundensis]